MSKELPNLSAQAGAYNPQEAEDKIYKKWEESGYFNPDKCIEDGITDKDAESFSIVMPPPNATGTLHLGHAVMLAIEDVMTRYHRMKGDKTLWIPGTDHAAIATQTKVEKILKEEGASRHKLGREKFLQRVDEFVESSRNTIRNQTRKMGSSCDWSREAFTLDEIRNKAVRVVFKMMYDDGLIYRGERIVNWCPRCHSTLADDEVEYKKQKAVLYTFKYNADFPFTISTTRPETKLGDTAVAVNPKDKRYERYIGKTYDVDFCGISLKLKIISDRNVDMEFGTGAVGVTPAHSMVDWQMGEENNLAIIKVIDEDGNIKKGFGEFSGKTAVEARKILVNNLSVQGLIEKEEEIDNNLSVCYRCETPIEPLPSLQWFISVDKKISKYGKSIKELCLDAVKKGVFGRDKIKIVPERFEKDYFHWMENLRDWCISRQIWYGHRVPVYYKSKACPETAERIKSQKSKVGEQEVFVGINPPEGVDWAQDTDTLDTWFSSGMWTFTAMAKSADEIRVENEKLVIDSEDFKNYHPTAALETGYDILFFWVARMIIMTTYAVGDIPFQDVYLHGLVRDEHGKKMSKSLGNVIDPLDMIKKYGTDAVRLSLIMGSAPGNDTRLSEEKIAGFRNFTNKLWNISRYIISNFKFQISKEFQNSNNKFLISNIANLTLADKWILGKLETVVRSVTDDIENYRFSQAGETLRDFTWNDFADWYLEVSKFESADKTSQSFVGDCDGDRGGKDEILIFVLENLLKLWHPFMPFVTEEIWEEMDKEKILMVEKWPTQESNKAIKQESNKSENQKTPLDAPSFSAESSGVEPHSDKESLRYQLRVATAQQYSPDVSADLLYQNINKKQSQKNFRTVSHRNSSNVVPQVDTCNKKYSKFKDFVKPSVLRKLASIKSTADKQEKNNSDDDFEVIKNIIILIRNARSQYKINPSQKIKAVIYAGHLKEIIESQSELIKKLKTGIEELEIKERGDKIKDAIFITTNEMEIYLVISDFDFSAECARLEKEIKEMENRILGLKKRLANTDFVQRAPHEIVEKEKEKLAAWESEIEKMREQVEHFR